MATADTTTLRQAGYLKQQAAAAFLGVTVRTLARWEQAGEVRGHSPMPGGVRLYPIEALESMAVAKGMKVTRPLEPKQKTYFIAADNVPLVKIGVAWKIRNRLRQLQNMCPVPLKCIGYLDHNDECELHSRFAYLRAHGEWFRLEPELAEFIRTEALAFQ